MLRMPVQFIQNYRPNSHCTAPKILLQIIIKWVKYKNSKSINIIINITINIKINIIKHAKELRQEGGGGGKSGFSSFHIFDQSCWIRTRRKKPDRNLTLRF